MKYALRITGGIFLVFILLGIAIYAIFSFKKESINEMALRQVNNQVEGIVSIGDLSPDFFRTFPNISVRLSDVSIRDSLWDVHQHDFLMAKKIYIRFQLLSLLKGKPRIGKVIVEDGSIYLYTDECGYCNLNRRNDVAFKKGKSDIPEITFINTRLVIENQNLNSYHDIQANYIDCDITKKDSALVLAIEMNSFVHSIGFNMAKGSYLKEKQLDGDFRLLYKAGDKIELNNVNLDIDEQPFVFNGNIFLNTEPMTYELHFQTKKVIYQKGKSLLTQSLQQKLDSIDIVEPFDAEASLYGQMAFRAVPVVKIHFDVSDAAMETPLGQLYHCSFKGHFSNRVDTLLVPGDINSNFTFNEVQAEWSEIPVTSSAIQISNLLHPYLICDLKSIFELQNLNQLAESSTISFLKGMGNLDIKYSGPLNEQDTLNPLLNGTLTLSDAEINYIPRNLLFKDGFGVLEFKNEDLVIKQLLLTAGNTKLTLDGNVNNLLAMLQINPEKLTMEWNIATPELDLNDFVTYVAPRKEVVVPKSSKRNKIIKATENIDKLLRDGTAKLTISADELIYKKFAASNVAASVLLVGNRVVFNDVKLNHAGGTGILTGSMTNGANSSSIDIDSKITRVDIPGLFRSFDNFGQDAITHQNMKGQMSAGIKVSGVLTEKATVVENSMKGTVDFSIINGELNNFEPIVKIAETAFKNRDFSKMQFAELKNRIEINGSAITIHKMEIRSNVAILFVEGIYDSKKGTDMSIQVPVSNLSKVENDELKNTGRAGVNVRLRAKTGEDGKLKISWDPFNSAKQERKQESKK